MPPTVVGRFEVMGLLGRGGMGAVYQARDPDLGRAVAIKLIDEPHASRSLRLLREAQALAQLQHPNVVAIHEVGTAGDRIYIAMELVDGHSLADLVPPPATWRDVVALFVQAGRGLAAAHARGLVHRDVKPSNILVGRDGRVRVSDFGLARLGPGRPGEPSDASTPPAPVATAVTVDASESSGDDVLVPAGASPPLLGSDLTAAGALLGTPRYMAPEQHGRLPATEKSDQFAFCVALWETLFGEHPFVPHGDGWAAAVLAGKRRPPAKRAPAWLVRELDRGLARDPEARHPSMAALTDRLEHGAARRARRLIAGAGLVVIAAAAIAGWRLSDRAPASVGCGDAGAGFTRVWSAERRAAIERGFPAARAHGADTAQRTVAMVDRYGERWRAARIDACRATHARGEQSTTMLDRRMQCLDRAVGEVDAVLGRLAGGGEAVDRALSAVASFPDPSACNAARLEAALPVPDDPRAATVRRELGAARAAAVVGDLAAARAAVTTARRAADDLGHPGLRAEVAIRHAAYYDDDPDLQATLERALADAVAAGDRELEAQILVFLLAQASGRVDARSIETLLPVARAAAQRAGVSLALRGEFHHTEADALTRLGRIDDALAACDRFAAIEEPPRWRSTACRCIANVEGMRLDAAYATCKTALETAETAFGPSNIRVGDALGALARVTGMIGRDDESRALRQRDLDLTIAHYGPDGERTAHALCGLGYHYMGADDLTEARPLIERCLAILERREAGHAPTAYRAGAQRMFGELLVRAGDVDRGLDQLDRALRLMETVTGSQSEQVATTLAVRADVLSELARWNDVVASARRCVELSVASLGADNPLHAACAVLQARALRELRRYPEALAAARDAVAQATKAGGDPADLGYAHMVLGSVQAALRQRAPARASFERALAILRPLGERAKDYTDETVQRMAKLRR